MRWDNRNGFTQNHLEPKSIFGKFIMCSKLLYSCDWIHWQQFDVFTQMPLWFQFKMYFICVFYCMCKNHNVRPIRCVHFCFCFLVESFPFDILSIHYFIHKFRIYCKINGNFVFYICFFYFFQFFFGIIVAISMGIILSQ